MDIASLIKQPAAAGGIETQLNSILRAVRTHLGMEVAFISEFSEGRRVFRQVDSAEGKECIEVGGSDLLEESYCHWIAEGRLPRLMRDPAKHPFAASFPATHELPVGAHISIPIRLRDGRVYGTFCCFSFSRDLSLTERDLATMEAFAQVARDHIQENLDREREAQRIAEQITSIIENGDLEIVYQPAIRIDLPRVEFVEALSRFSSQPYESPDRWFHERQRWASAPRWSCCRCALRSTVGLSFRRDHRSASTFLPKPCSARNLQR